VISAVNCAEQESCSDYGIVGTPTVRFFMPNIPAGSTGLDIDAHDGVRTKTIDTTFAKQSLLLQ
jgi:hypothetical protein